MRPAIATLTLSEQGVVSLALETNLEAWLAGVNPALADTVTPKSLRRSTVLFEHWVTLN